MRHLPPVAALAASLAAASPALAEDEPTGIYVNNRSHVRVGAGVGLGFPKTGSLSGVQPQLGGRFRLSDRLGLTFDVPLGFVSLDDGAGAVSHLHAGNPGVGVEWTVRDDGQGFARFHAGVSAPAFSLSDDPEDRVLQLVSAATAQGATGLQDAWRFAPDTLGVFAGYQAELLPVDFYNEFAATLGAFIPTSDAAELELLLQARVRLGVGSEGLIWFGGLTSTLSLTDLDYQGGLQLGALAAVGTARLDVTVQVNLDAPAGFSLSDEGILGLHVGATVPF